MEQPEEEEEAVPTDTIEQILAKLGDIEEQDYDDDRPKELQHGYASAYYIM